MNTILEWLEGGDLRSDGAANQAAEVVLKNDVLINDLIEGLRHPDDIVRGRTMDALEKVARKRPDLLRPFMTDILALVANRSSDDGAHARSYALWPHVGLRRFRFSDDAAAAGNAG